MKIIKTFYDSFVVKRNPPKNLNPGDDIYFGGPGFECLIERSYLAAYKNVIVSGEGVVLKNFIPQKEFITCYHNDFRSYRYRYAFYVLRNFRLKKIDSDKKYLLIFDNYSGPKGFAHWLSDGLPRLVEMKDELKNYTVVVPEYFNEEKIYKETLALFELGDREIIPKKHCIKVKQLFVIKPIGESGDFLPENILKLREFVWKKTRVAQSSGEGEKIYISRKKATRRFIENEKDVIELLKGYGFKVVYMEDYSFEEQVRIVYNAKHLVSIHGAALAHIHFMQTGANVLEIKKIHDVENCHFYSLADALSVNYYYQFCAFKEKAKAANNYDLFVDLEALNNNIRLMLSNN